MSAIFSPGSGEGLMHNEFMGFVGDDASLLTLRGWAERQSYPPTTVRQGGPEMFAQMLEAAAPPKIALVDIDGHGDPVAAAARLAGLAGRACRLIMAGSINDVALYRRMIGAGAVDYLVKPLSPEQLTQALAAALRGQGAGKPAAKEARIVTFIGARGGVGASTIALNTAWLMAHELGRAVCILDLDLQFGTSSLALDLEPGRGLRDIVGSPHRVDSLMISSSMVPESDNLSVLGAEEAVDESVHMDGGAITALLKEIKNNFEIVVIDLPRFLLAAQKRILTVAHDIVIVSELTLAGIRDTLRIKNAVAALGCTASVTIIAARTNAAGTGQIDRAVFEKGIQGKIDATLFEDAPSLMAAANSGKALGEVAPRAAITRSLRELAAKLAKIEAEAKQKTSLLSKLLGKKKETRSEK